MFVSSNRFDRDIRNSHDVAARCDVIDPSGTNIVAQLDIVSGNVSADASRKIRRQCSLTMQDPTGALVPNTAQDWLQPLSGYTLQLHRGIAWKDGSSELFPLGTFMPYNPRVNDNDETLQVQIDGYDRSKIISRTRWTQPYSIPAGTNTGTAIRALLLDRMPSLRFNFEPTNTTVPATILGANMDENDPWNDAVALASADGMDLYFDARDIVTLRRVPDPDTDPVVATYDDGTDGTVVNFTRQNNGDVAYTGIIVTSEGSGVTPRRLELWRPDTDIRIPYFYTTSFINTDEQMMNTALSLYRKVTRAQYGVEIQALADPRQEVDDVIRIVRAKSKINDVFSIVNMTMPLDAETLMSLQSSQRRTAG